MNSDNVLLVEVSEPDPGVALVTLNRPEARNALSRAMIAELRFAIGALSHRDDLRAVILTGAGDKAFCAGADLKERLAMTADDRTAHTQAILTVIEEIAALPVPVIGAVNGYALAGGAELALACDIRLGTPSAVFGFPEVKLGIFPGAGGVVRLPRLIGASRANDLLYSGRQLDAAEAHRIGLLDALTPATELHQRSIDRAAEVAQNAPLAIRALKRALRDSEGLAMPDALTAVELHRRPLDSTADYAEGLAAFAEKRDPTFTGR